MCVKNTQQYKYKVTDHPFIIMIFINQFTLIKQNSLSLGEREKLTDGFYDGNRFKIYQ